MSVKPALYSMITGDAGIAALIGDRFYPDVIPQDAPLPACAYQTITTARDYSHDGQTSLAEPRIQITISALSRASAEAVAEALRTLLSGYRGEIDGTTIGSIFLENEYDGYNLDSGIITVRQDYRITWKEL